MSDYVFVSLEILAAHRLVVDREIDLDAADTYLNVEVPCKATDRPAAPETGVITYYFHDVCNGELPLETALLQHRIPFSKSIAGGTESEARVAHVRYRPDGSRQFVEHREIGVLATLTDLIEHRDAGTLDAYVAELAESYTPLSWESQVTQPHHYEQAPAHSL